MDERAYVFDASPVILLARVESLQLIRSLGPDQVAPVTVFQEVTAGNHHDGAAQRMEAAGVPRIVADVAPDPRVLAWGLDRGETSVLSLALAIDGIAVLDDLAARRCGTRLGLPLIGTAGLVGRFKLRGIIPSAASLLADLRRNGLRLATQVEAELLRMVGE